MAATHSTDVRADKWLWAARFYKTRALAAESLSGGKTRVNGARCKPSRALQIGDELTIRKGPYDLVVIVEVLSVQRGSARQAACLYRETEASIAARELLREQLRANAPFVPAPSRRPDNKARRQLRRFVRGDG